MHNRILIHGDAGIEMEKDILKNCHLNDIDFLKVGHHESNTSSSKYFIDKINPKYSLISIGSNTTRKIQDYKLSRYACYLIVQNYNPRIKIIALAQTYFAIQTRKQELSKKRI